MATPGPKSKISEGREYNIRRQKSAESSQVPDPREPKERQDIPAPGKRSIPPVVSAVAPTVLRAVRVFVVAAATIWVAMLVDKLSGILCARHGIEITGARTIGVAVAFLYLQWAAYVRWRAHICGNPLTSFAYTRPHALHNVRGPSHTAVKFRE